MLAGICLTRGVALRLGLPAVPVDRHGRPRGCWSGAGHGTGAWRGRLPPGLAGAWGLAGAQVVGRLLSAGVPVVLLLACAGMAAWVVDDGTAGA